MQHIGGTPLSLEGARAAKGFDNDIAFYGRSPKRVCWSLGRNLPCEQEAWYGEEGKGFGLELSSESGSVTFLL